MKKIYLVGLAFALLTAYPITYDRRNLFRSRFDKCREWRIRATGYRGRLVWSGIHIAGRFTKWGFPIYLHGESCRPHVSLPNR